MGRAAQHSNLLICKSHERSRQAGTEQLRSFSVQFERFGELGEKVRNLDGLLRVQAYQRDHVNGTDCIERKNFTAGDF